MIAYLSGGMEYADNKGANWRTEITAWLKESLGHDVIDPVIESSNLVKKHEAENYREWKQSDPDRYKTFVRLAIDQDLRAVIGETNYLICLWDSSVLKGGGTHGEITLAYFIGKPVYLVNKLPQKDLSSWIMACATQSVSDFDNLKDVLKQKYGHDDHRT
ncbi:MAG: hypothetical protein VX600_01300 [Candidatus Neomarinimicrobiota bacterium]|jgi:hypothetical protein|nr:hypothetical protein [Candidatus Neomarinimicrobiota bacterium]|tara:strand:+ start:163 stop:642 length:480 start_codon:yes stop_codon:yes gene_type:complete